MSKFKVGDCVVMHERPKGFFVVPTAVDEKGVIAAYHRTDHKLGKIWLVEYKDLCIKQFIPESCLELVVVKKPRKVSTNAKSQINRILQYLLTGNSLTPVKAITLFGAYRLAARIYELRAAGHKIKAVNKTDLNGRVYAEYTLRKAGRVGA